MLRSLIAQVFSSEDPGVDNFGVPTCKIFNFSLLSFDIFEVHSKLILVSKVNSCCLMALTSFCSILAPIHRYCARSAPIPSSLKSVVALSGHF